MRHLLVTSRFFFITFLLAAGFFSPWKAYGKTPNDPGASQWFYSDMKAFDAWERTTGSRDVVVAVIDNGFDTFHPDLYENAWRNEKEIAYNGVDDDGNGFVDDVWGWNFADENNDPRPQVVNIPDAERTSKALHHGTMVAGLIGAVGDNAKDGAGVAWQVRMMNVKVIGNTGVGDIRNLDRAIRYAADNGADIINFSVVSDQKPNLQEALRYAYDRGAAVIAAVGNEGIFLGGMPRYPACIDADGNNADNLVLGISAFNEEHLLARFSNFGSSCVDMTAPGTNVKSTLRYAPMYGFTETFGGGFNGTSFAAPLVSGTAALLKSIHPEWGPAEIYNTLMTAVNKSPTEHEDEYRNLFGVGRVQADKAVALALATASPRRALSHALVVDEGSGAMEERLPGAASHSGSSPVRQGDSVAAAAYRGQTFFVSARHERVRGRVTGAAITIWNGMWQSQLSLRIPAQAPVEVAFGDVLGDEAPEIIVAPASADRRVFEIFSFGGASLRRADARDAHDGVVLGFGWNSATKKQEILAVYKENAAPTLHRYDADGRNIAQFALPSVLSQPGGAAAADVNADGREDYVLTVGAGGPPSVYMYDPAGNFMLQYFADNPASRTGLRLASGDFDKDGKDDLITVPISGTGLARVWDATARKLLEWPVAGGARKLLTTFAEVK